MAKQLDAVRSAPRMTVWAAAVVLAALLALAIACGSGEDSGFSDLGGNYVIPAGKTHHGDLRLFKGTVTVAGKQDGDLRAFVGTLEIPGEVTGEVKFVGGNLTVAGKVGKDLDARGANCDVPGTVGGDLDAKCGTVTLPSGSHVVGDASLYAGQINMDGAIDGDLTAEGGQLSLSGTVGKDASLRADLLKVDPKARIAGNLSYDSRVPPTVDEKTVVGGTIDREHKIHVHVDRHRSIAGSIAWWLLRLVLSLLLGLAALALARKPGEAVLAAAGSDFLRNLGVGFLAFIVVPVAAVVSCILIVTIPLAAAVLLLYVLAVFLARVPVGVVAGRFILTRLGRPAPSVNMSYTVGIVALYVVFAIPVIRVIAGFACVFLGLGAMVMGIRDWRQSRRQAAPAPTAGAAPPTAPEPPAIPPGFPSEGD